MKKQLVIDGFVFSLNDDTPYETLRRVSDGGFTSQPVVGGKPINQQTGQAGEQVSITAKWIGAAGMDAAQTLRDKQNQGNPVLIVDGYGRNLGFWKIDKLTETHRRVIDDGTALVVGVDIELGEY